MRRVPGIAWVAAGAALWGTDAALRRPLTGVLTPIQLVFYEHLILSLIVLPIFLRHRSYLPKLSPKSWAAVGAISWIGSIAGTVLFTYAVRAGNPTTAVLLQKTQPVFAIVLARAILGERWRRTFPAVVALALIGAYLISFGGGNLLMPWKSLDAPPAIFALAAALGWGSATVFGRLLSEKVPFELITALRVLFAVPPLFVGSIYEGLVLPRAPQFLPLAYLAVVPGFAGLMLYYRGLRSTPASQATIGELAFPATAALLNWSVLGVKAAPISILGFAVVWCAILLLSSRGLRG